MAITGMYPGLGWELDARLLLSFRLARPEGRSARGCCELRPQSKPVPRPTALRGSRRQEMAIAGSAQPGQLRLEWRRFTRAWVVPGYGSLASMRVFAEGAVIVGA